MEGHTKKEIAEITGLKERQVQFYTEQGVITPEIDRGEGRGKSRRYSERNVTQFLVIKSLSSLGMTVSRIREVIRFMDNPNVLKRYEQARAWDNDFVIKVYQTEDGRLECRWHRFSYRPDHSYPVVISDEINVANEVLVINVSRLDGRVRPARKRPSQEELAKELKRFFKE